MAEDPDVVIRRTRVTNGNKSFRDKEIWLDFWPRRFACSNTCRFLRRQCNRQGKPRLSEVNYGSFNASKYLS